MDADRILVVGGRTGIGAGVVAAFPGRCTQWSRSTGVDATDPVQVASATEELVRREGVPSAVVHCVGDFEERALLASDEALLGRMFASNVASAFTITRAWAPRLAAAGRGRIVLFAAAGVDDRRAKPRAPVYFACKAALVSLARSLALELAPSGVTVNVISPGIIRHPHSHTESQQRMLPSIPAGRPGTVADVVRVVEFLLSSAAAYVTGTELPVDGGLAVGNRGQTPSHG